MGMIDRFKAFVSAGKDVKNAGYPISDIDSFKEAFGLTGDVSDNRLYSATYYACMQIRCNAISKLPLKIMQSTAEGSRKADDHYLYQLLKRRPNPYMSTVDFLFATEFQKLEYGDAFIYASTNRGKITGLYLLDSRNMTIYVDDAGIIDRNKAVWYVYQARNGKTYRFEHSEIIHLKNFSKDGLIGTPVKKYLAESIQNEQYANKFINNYWSNGVQGRAILQYTQQLDPKLVDKLRKRFEGMMSGVKNAGRIIPIELGFEVKEFNPKLVDSQFFELQGLTIKHIANAFGVKLYQLNDLQRSTYSNIETQNRAFLSDTLQNVIMQYEQEFDEKLFSRAEKAQGYFHRFSLDSLLRSDFAQRMAAYRDGIQNGVLAPADCRNLEDLPFIEGSDNLFFNGNMIPVQLAGKQYTNETVNDPETKEPDENEPLKGGEDDEQDSEQEQ